MTNQISTILLMTALISLVSSCEDDTSGYDCRGGTCYYVSSDATYSEEASCENNCGGYGGYNCISGNCSSVNNNADYYTLSACENACGSSNCNYYQYTGADNCDVDYDPVSSSGCCPYDYPYYCSGTNQCYSSCEAADAVCSSTTVIRANSNGGNGSSGYNCINGTCTYVSSNADYSTLSSCESNCGGASCYSLNGIWTRTSTDNGCQGMTISFSGTQGSVTYSPSSCCFDNGDAKWKNFSSANCTVEDMHLNSVDCSFTQYTSDFVYFNGPDEINIGGITYTK